MTTLDQVILLEGKLHAAGDPQLPFHKINTSGRLSDRMLHLKSGVHLHEIEILVAIHHELDRSPRLCTQLLLRQQPLPSPFHPAASVVITGEGVSSMIF